MLQKLLFALIFSFALAAHGKNAVVWNGNSESLSIGDKVFILEDEANTKSINWVASADAQPFFFQSNKKNVVFNDDHHYWMRVEVENTTQKNLVLELAQPVLKSVEFYYQDEKTGNWEVVYSGYAVPLTSKVFKHTYQTFRLPKASGTYYLKFQSNSFSIPVRIWEENHYSDKLILERLAFGVFSGLMLFAVLLNVFLFVSFRKWAYLHYAILVTLFYFTASCVEGYAALLAPYVDLMYGVAIVAAISMPIGTSYGLIFLEARRYTPKIYKIGIALIIYYFIFLVFHFWLEPLPLHILTSIGGLLNVAFTVVLAYSTWKRGNKLGYHYFLIYTIFFAMAVVDSVNRFTGYPPSIFELSFISFAFLFEAFALSYLLTKRFEWERTEMMEAKIDSDRLLLNQMEENERIIKNQNLVLEQKVKERTQELLAEKQKSDELLLNILPLEVAEELKSTGRFKTRKYESVSILFTDIVGFTQLSEMQTGEEIVNELDDCFREFDRITKKHNLEKIKTIGDCYMCAGGLPIEYSTHAVKIIRAAREMVAYMERIKKEKQKNNKPFFEIRVGINSGAVIAGIVGSDKFAYDIWGDSVNVASRMEQNSKPGMINISEDTYQLVKDVFEVEYRGRIQAKNKGEMDMYFVVGEKRVTLKSGTNS